MQGLQGAEVRQSEASPTCALNKVLLYTVSVSKRFIMHIEKVKKKGNRYSNLLKHGQTYMVCKADTVFT